MVMVEQAYEVVQEGASTMDWVIVAATVVIAGSSIASLWVTWRLSQDNRTLRRAGTEPEVVAYLQIGPRRGLLNFTLANVGQGPARHVEVSFLADAADFANHEVVPQPNQYQKVATVLPQGDRHEMFFGRVIAAVREPRLQPFKVSVRFMDLRDREVEKTFDLDLTPFESSRYVTIKTEHDVALAIEQLHKDLSSVINSGIGGHRLRVETITTEERLREQEDFLNERARRKADSEANRGTDAAPPGEDS